LWELVVATGVVGWVWLEGGCGVVVGWLRLIGCGVVVCGVLVGWFVEGGGCGWVAADGVRRR
jgi:hypothetical protein